MNPDTDDPRLATRPAWTYPAGWMQDPFDSSQWRYWNRAEWTTNTAPYKPAHTANHEAVIPANHEAVHRRPQIINGFAAASFLCGLGILIIPLIISTGPDNPVPSPLPSIISACLALIFGLVALSQIRRSNGSQGGRMLAITGLALGGGPFVILGLIFLLLVLWEIFLPS